MPCSCCRCGESGRLAHVVLAGRPAVQRSRAAFGGLRKTGCYAAHMMNSRIVVESLSSSDLRSATRELVRRSNGSEAALLLHLGEIDERKLYLDWAFSSIVRLLRRRAPFLRGRRLQPD